MKEHLLRQSLENPLVLQCLKWRHSVNRVPVQTLVDKVQELGVLALAQHILECLRVWQSTSASRVRHNDRIERILLEEQVATRAELNDVVRRHTLNLHHISQLLCFVLTREQRVASI